MHISFIFSPILIFTIPGIGCFELVTSSVSTVNIAVNDLLHMQHGMGWPYVLQLLEGQDALVYLKSLTRDDNIESCYVTSPLGEKFNVNSPPSSKYALSYSIFLYRLHLFYFKSMIAVILHFFLWFYFRLIRFYKSIAL